MNIFFLNLASHQGLLACVGNYRVLSSFAVDHRIDDAALVPHVEAVIHKAGWSYPDLTQIACVVGPGGFTSLRVAVALTNALSHELKIPVCGVHLSDLYRVRFSGPGPTSAPAGATAGRSGSGPGALWLHSTKKQELFLRGF